MTVGNPVRLIIQFMIPMFLGNIFQQFYNIVDSIVAGQFIGVDALAAIGSTGSLMFFVTGWLNGLSSAFSSSVSSHPQGSACSSKRKWTTRNQET